MSTHRDGNIGEVPESWDAWIDYTNTPMLESKTGEMQTQNWEGFRVEYRRFHSQVKNAPPLHNLKERNSSSSSPYPSVSINPEQMKHMGQKTQRLLRALVSHSVVEIK